MAGGWLQFLKITKQFIWDKGVNQLVTMASFDHFAQILLIQIVLIAVFFGVAFYVFQKSDMAKRNNFMYFPWMEHLFVWIFPFCVSLFIVVTGFKIQSYTGGILAAVIATIIYYIVEKRKKRRAVFNCNWLYYHIITTDPSSFIGNDRNRALPSSVKITEKMV